MFDLRKIFDLRKFFTVPKNFLKSKIHCTTYQLHQHKLSALIVSRTTDESRILIVESS